MIEDAEFPLPEELCDECGQPIKRVVPCTLTERQLQILRAAAAGLTPQQTALRYGISATTVRSHLHIVFRTVGVHDKTQAVLKCAANGWLGKNVVPRQRKARY